MYRPELNHEESMLLALYAKGYEFPEIRGELNISFRDINFSAREVKRKMGVPTMHAAVEVFKHSFVFGR